MTHLLLNDPYLPHGVPQSYYNVVNVADGWTFLIQEPESVFLAATGDVRIFDWKSLCNWLFCRESMCNWLFCRESKVNLDGKMDMSTEISIGDLAWNPASYIVSVGNSLNNNC